MKNLAIPIFVALLVVLLATYLVAFQVRETEIAYVTRFEKPVRDLNEPGLYFRLPTPIDVVHRYDARMRVFEGTEVETTTREAIPIIAKPYVVWRIANALQFGTSVRSVAEAEKVLFNWINDSQNRVIGRHAFGEFVNSDPGKVQIEQIHAEMLEDLRRVVREGGYGIEIDNFAIKQLKISKDVSEKVFDRMKAARDLKTKANISQGEADAKAIRTEADSISTKLLAAAESRAKAIRGEGDAQAAQYYEMLEEEPDFAIFLKNLESLKGILAGHSTFVVPTDAEPFRYLIEVPDLEPGK